MSRQHRILVRSPIALGTFQSEEALVPAIQLVGLPRITIDTDVDHVPYFYLMLGEHQVVLSNDALTKSLYLGPQTLHALGAGAVAEIGTISPDIVACTDFLIDLVIGN